MIEISTEQLLSKSWQYRRNILKYIKHAGAGHTGGSLSCVDILNVLYNRILNVSPGSFNDPNRDRYIQSNDPTWRRLQQLAEHARSRRHRVSDDEIAELVSLYQRVSAQLSHARTTYADPELNARLSRILGEARNVIYRTRAEPAKAVAVRDAPSAAAPKDEESPLSLRDSTKLTAT